MAESATAIVAPNQFNDEFQQILDKLTSCDQAVVQKLEGLYALVRVSVHRWRGRHQIQNAEVVIGEENLANKSIASKPYWHLEPPEWKTKFDIIEQQKEEILQIYSKPCKQLIGVRVVMADKLEECCSRLQALEDVFLSTADDFTTEENYAKVLEYIEEQLGDDPASQALEDAKQHVPHRKAIRGRYKMERHVIPTSIPDWALEGDGFHAQELRKTGKQMLADNLLTLTQQPREELSAYLWSDDPKAPGLINQLAAGYDEKNDEWLPKPKRRVSRDSVAALQTKLTNFLNFDDAIDQQTLDDAEALSEELKTLHDMMELEVGKGKRISLNSDDQLAIHWAQQLSAFHNRLKDEGAMLEGLRRFCESAGVTL